MSSWSERVAGELHATLGELSSDVSKGRGEACGVWPNTEPPHPATHQAPLVWRAPEGPEGTGGLRGAAPNEVRPPSLAGGRTLRRLEHPWGHKQPGPKGLAAAGDQAATQSDKRNQTKSGGPQENLGTTTHAFTCVN